MALFSFLHHTLSFIKLSLPTSGISNLQILKSFGRRRRLRRRPLEGHLLQVRRKQDWGRGFIFFQPHAAILPASDAGSDVVKPASSFVIQNHQTSCSMWCPKYEHAIKT